jgi:hypothetical protein
MKRYFVDDGIVEEMQSRRWGGIVAEGASGSPPTAGLIMGGDLKEQERHNSPIPHQSFKEVANLYRPKTSRITPRRQQRAIFANGYGRTDEEYWNVEMFIVKVAGARKRGHILQKDE